MHLYAISLKLIIPRSEHIGAHTISRKCPSQAMAPWHPRAFGALTANGPTSCSPNEPWCQMSQASISRCIQSWHDS